MAAIYPAYASAAFGLEGLIADELRKLCLHNVHAENGGVAFSASAEELFRCNLSLRCCDRVFVLLADEPCTSFESLFQIVSSIPWENWADGTEAFNISARCARSRLMSPRDCQSITKKAIIERLRAKKHLSVFPESGAPFPVQLAVHSDRVKILLNTSGDALSRRGYRTWNGEAPLKETLAAALVLLSSWDRKTPLCDPCCGTGTILAEAAWIAAGRMPGLSRSFAMESFFPFLSLDFQSLRTSLSSGVDFSILPPILGSDIDPEALRLAILHMKQASLSSCVSLSQKPLQELILDEPCGTFICNPPYGERLGDRNTCHQLYRDLHALKDRHPGWSMGVISSDSAFERFFGKRADKRRRLYNGRLECAFYLYR